MGIELKTKSGNITLTAPKASGGGSVDLSNYYTKAQTDAKIKEAVDNIDIPEVDFTGYATETYVQDVVAQDTQSTQNWANNKFAEKKDIPDTSKFITEIPTMYVTENELENTLNDKGYLTEHQDLTDYAKKSDIPDVSEYQTEAQVIALIEQYGSDIPNAEGVYY